jgi:hypothetical protein
MGWRNSSFYFLDKGEPSYIVISLFYVKLKLSILFFNRSFSDDTRSQGHS